MVIILNHTVVATYLYLKDKKRFKPRPQTPAIGGTVAVAEPVPVASPSEMQVRKKPACLFKN